mgnify:CR=1 FL=1
MKRKVKVDMQELVIVLDMNFPEQRNFLDLETGKIVSYTDEFARELEDIYEEIYDEAGNRTITLEAYLEGRDDPDWRKDVLLTADRVEMGYGTRYIRVERDDAYGDYNDMQCFIRHVENSRLRDQLWNAIQGRGAFRRFNGLLARHPAVEEQWYDFKEERLQRRVRDWLAYHDIEPIDS